MEQILQNAKKTLYPRLVLYEALAKFKGGHERRQPSSDSISEARRDFLDSFAYLCDIHKGGATVTAAGLQKLPYSNILWLAANEGIRSEVKRYADTILQKLVAMDSTTEPAVRDDIFQRAVNMCAPRLAFYKTELQTYATKCRMELRKDLPDEAGKTSSSFQQKKRLLILSAISLRKILKRLSEPPVALTLARLVELCYNMRGPGVETIRGRSTHPQDDFGKLAHYIGRLGATRSSVDAVVRTWIQVPALWRISQIRFIDAPEGRTLTLSPEDLIPYEIVWAISKDTPSQNTIDIRSSLHSLVDLDYPSNDTTDNPIRANLADRRTILTRVHAELQIGNQFSRHRYEFVDGDKYIGCSKPACYFCYNWLGNHKPRYVQPATHHKIIPGCRGPDNNINESGATILKEMYTKMTLGVGQHILDFLLNVRSGDKTTGGRHQYMSTEGTSRAPSRISIPWPSHPMQGQV